MNYINFTDLTNKKEFHAMFEITRNIIFEVSYYTLGSNKSANFTTSANELNRPKSDYKQCGQAQESLLPKGSKARRFYELWDNKHLSDLTTDEYDEMITDLEVLRDRYNSRFYDNARDHIPFYEVVEFSKLPLKPKPKRASLDIAS